MEILEHIEMLLGNIYINETIVMSLSTVNSFQPSNQNDLYILNNQYNIKYDFSIKFLGEFSNILYRIYSTVT